MTVNSSKAITRLLIGWSRGDRVAFDDLVPLVYDEGFGSTVTVPITQPGSLAGTIAHMAPELLQGGQADARSDLWALGVLMFEMTAGVAPFRGATEYELGARILREPPAPLPSGTPAGVAVVLKCLSKDPGQRFQQAAEVRAAFDPYQLTLAPPAAALPQRRRSRTRLLAAGAIGVALAVSFFAWYGPQKSLRSIAVLPSAGAEGSADTEYLGDGLTEGVINSLAQMPQSPLKVIALNSVLR